MSNSKCLKVWTYNKSSGVYISCTSFEEFLEAVKKKFNIPAESSVRIVDTDACEIDDNSIMQIPDYSSLYFLMDAQCLEIPMPNNSSGSNGSSSPQRSGNTRGEAKTWPWPLRDMAVTDLPGIGKILGGKLLEKGFTKATHVLVHFMDLEKSGGDFKEWLKETEANEKQREDCYGALKDWCDWCDQFLKSTERKKKKVSHDDVTEAQFEVLQLQKEKLRAQKDKLDVQITNIQLKNEKLERELADN